MNNTSLNNIQSSKEVAVTKVKHDYKKGTSFNDFEKILDKTSKKEQGKLKDNTKDKLKNKTEDKLSNKTEDKLNNKPDNKLKDKTASEKEKTVEYTQEKYSKQNTIKDNDTQKEENSSEVSERTKNILNLLEKMINGEMEFDLNILEKAFNELSSQDIKEISLISDLDLEKIKSIKTDILQMLNKNLDVIKQDEKSLNKFAKLLESVNENMNHDENTDLKSKIISALKEKLQASNTAQTPKVKEGINVNLQREGESNLNESESDFLQNNFSKSTEEDKLLKQIAFSTKKEGTPKFERVINYMNSLNKTENINPLAEAANVDVPVIDSKNFTQDFIKNIKFMELNNVKEMTVKVMPKELGEIVIKLTMEKGIMKASITANDKETYKLLNTNYNELINKVSDEGIKIQNFTIDIYNGDTTFFSNEKNKQQNGQGSNRKDEKIGSAMQDDEKQINDNTTIEDNSSVNAFV